MISTAITLVAVAFITRYLGQKGFGEYTTVITFLSFFATAADLGLTLVTTQLISKPGVDEEKVLGNLFALRLVSALALLSLAPISVYFFPYPTEIKIGVLIAVSSFLFNALNQIFVGVFQKNLKMNRVVLAEFWSKIALIIFIFLFLEKYGLYGALAATTLSNFVSFFFHYYYSREFARTKLLFDFSYWKEILVSVWPLAITISLNLIYLRADTLLLSLLGRKYVPATSIMSEVGIYGAAYKVIDVFVTIPFMFAGLVLPIFTAAWFRSDKEKFKSIIQRSFDIMAIAVLPLAFGTQLVAGDVMALIAGEEFRIAGEPLKILIWATVFIFIGNVFAHAIVAIEKQRKMIRSYAICAFTSLIGYLLLIPYFSYVGAAWITIYSEAFIALASAYYLWREAKFLPDLKVLFKSLAASLLMYFAGKYLHHLGFGNLFLVIAVSMLVYGSAIYLSGGFTKRDLLDLLNK